MNAKKLNIIFQAGSFSVAVKQAHKEIIEDIEIEEIILDNECFDPVSMLPAGPESQFKDTADWADR